jgi:hypothetical protein
MPQLTYMHGSNGLHTVDLLCQHSIMSLHPAQLPRADWEWPHTAHVITGMPFDTTRKLLTASTDMHFFFFLEDASTDMPGGT